MTRAEIARLVPVVVREILPAVPAHTVTGTKHLRDLGADSIDRVEILLLLMDRIGLDEPLSTFADLPDLDAVVDVLTERSGR
jgi:polyketide biosynthesis acyl carrier protein